MSPQPVVDIPEWVAQHGLLGPPPVLPPQQWNGAPPPLPYEPAPRPELNTIWNPIRAYNEADRIADEEEALAGRAHNNLGDAARHARWTYRMSTDIGPHWAAAFGLGHELHGLLDGQPLRESRMDLNNNDIGIIAALLGLPIPDSSKPGLAYLTSDGEIAYLTSEEDLLER